MQNDLRKMLMVQINCWFSIIFNNYCKCFFVRCRHGRKHTINPSNINYRANIWALKQEGCTHVLATTACGSLQENIHPGKIYLQ